MAQDNSLYIGPRLRRLRREMGLTQADLAADLEVSASYIALIERNQRPLTAKLLLKLAEAYDLDWASFAGDGGTALASRLEEVVKDPLLADLDIVAADLRDLPVSTPGIAEALLRLHTAYKQGQMALADHSTTLGEKDPLEETRSFLAARKNYFPVLDERAERIARLVAEVGGLAAYIRATHEYEVRRFSPQVMRGAVRRMNPHRYEILLDDTLDAAGTSFQLALQIAYLDLKDSIETILNEAEFDSDTGRQVTRRALANYGAGAILMPYTAFHKEAEARGYDIEALGRHFGTSFEQTAHRLTTLQKREAAGVPFFFIRIDAAGNVSKRFDGAGFPFARHGGSCPKWSLHRTFQRPREILSEVLELPDGERFFSIARTVTSGGGAYDVPRVERAIALGCRMEEASRLVYAQGRDLAKAAATPMGVTCRLCHRADCTARAEPPIGRTLLADDFHRLTVPFGFSDN